MNEKTGQVVIILLIVFSLQRGWAEETMNLSLDKAIEIALENNLNIKQAQETITIGEAKVGKVKSEWYPNLTLGLGSGCNEILNLPGESQTFEFLGQTYEIKPPLSFQWSNTLSLRLTQNIYTGGRLRGSSKGVRAEFEARRKGYEVVKNNLILQVKKAYWELARADLLVRLSGETVDHHRQILELAGLRLSQGTIAPIEVEQARVNLVNEEDNLIQTQNRRRELEDELKALLEIEFEAGIVPIDEPSSSASPRIDIDEAINNGLKRRVELLKLRKELQAGEGALMVARSGRYPHLALRASYNWAGSNKNYKDAWKDLKESSWEVGLSLSYSIFDGHLTKNKIKEAESNLKIAEYALLKKEKEIVKEIRNACSKLILSRRRIEKTGKNVDLAEENSRIARLQFKMGAITSNEVNNYQVVLSQARTKHIEALIDYEIARAELEWAMGETR
ncbi:TPA: hypothetical protein DCX15_02800 [bacterium]|nr:hypothetical protein [bacterium]